jgi:hypothetical protein
MALWCTNMNRQDTVRVPAAHVMVKGKVHPITGQGSEVEYSTLSLTSALDGVGGQCHAPAALSPGKRPGTHCIGGWVGSRAGLEGCGISRPYRDLIPGPSSP